MSDSPFVLKGFEPVSRLGSGGFGEVWLARQVNIDRQVAIKIGHAPIDDKTVQLRFERECIALGRLSGHPNIIDVFTAGQLDDGRPYLVLEFVNGGTLWQRLQRSPLSESELCRVGVQLSDALVVAHEAGVLHRDLKPENVLLRQNGNAVLGDFGIARLHDGANTTSHAITASVAYAAPEILSGKSASVASDLYGIGICLLASVLRSVPFVNKTDESIHPIINRVLTDKPPDLSQHGVTSQLSAAINSLLEKDPDKRPRSAADAKVLLEHAANAAQQPVQHSAPATVVAPNPPPNATISGQRPAPPSGAPPGTGASPTVRGHAAPPPPGPTPPAPAPPGQVSPGHAPPGQVSPGYAPPGHTPPGHASPGQVPPRQAPPPAVVPQAFAPQQHPTGPQNAPAPTGFPASPGSQPAPPPAQQRPPGTPQPPANYPQAQQPRQPAGGLRPPPQSFTGQPSGNPPQQHQPYSAAGRPPTYNTTSSGGGNNDRLRVFALAFVATVVIGGLLLFALTRLSGDEQSSTDLTTIDDSADTTTSSTAPPPSASLSPTQPPTTELGPLALPLTIADTVLGSDATVTPDTVGPISPQFCDNTPVTVGLTEWEGETLGDPVGFPLVFQEIVRFDSAAQAEAYTTSYVATVNCDDWILPGEDGNLDLTIAPEVIDPAPFSYDDESHEIDFVGTTAVATVFARTAIVRIGVDVFVLSVTSLVEGDVAELDPLLDIAVDRLQP
ncbi:MAG: serine/threonine protein kinase [Acidimicrobiales bacterium]